MRSTGFIRLGLALASIATFLALMAISAGAQMPTPGSTRSKKVLMFSSDPFVPAIGVIESAIRERVKENPDYRIEFFKESLDQTRISGEKYDNEMLNLVRTKYKEVDFDLIFATGTSAISFLLKHEAEVFTTVPKVFSALDERQIQSLDLGRHTTGVAGRLEFGPTVDLMLSQNPGAKRIVVINGFSEMEGFILAQAKREFEPFADRIEFVYPELGTIDQVKQEVSSLRKGDLVIYLAFNRDVTGRGYSLPEGLAIVTPTASVPVYSIADSSIGAGAVGGQVLSFRSLGNNVGEMGLRVLAGEEPRNIPPRVAATIPMFDWRQLRKWGINENILPAGSIVEFRTPSVWEQYRTYIVAALALMIFQSMLITSLLINRSRRRKAELERKEFEELAALEHERLNEIVANTPGVVWEAEIDPTTGARRMKFVSDYIEEMLGYSVDEWLSTPGMATSLVIDEDRPSVEAAISSIVADGNERTIQFRWQAKNGAIVWAESHFVPNIDENGQTIGLRGVAMDVSDRMAAVEAVSQSEARFRNMANTAPVLIWMSDVEPLITFVNKLVLDYTGLSEEALFGTGWLQAVHEDDRQHTVDVYSKGYKKKEPWVQEYRLRGADGIYRWFYVTSAPRFASDGEFLGYIGSCIDINDRKAMEESLQSALTEIKKLKDGLQEENIYLKEMIKLEHDFDEIIGRSDEIKYVLFKIKQVAPTDATVLISGETGTGKELVARALHKMSPRKNRPLVKVNCAALSASLIESELFGHERGSFTGATARKIGRFELADGGTIFLDEIGELPLELQPKLLRLIQEGEFERLGSSTTLTADVRVIAATNRELHNEVKNGRFREDLLYRLNVFPITVPPLRQRTVDIPLLVEYFTNIFSKKMGKTITSVSPAVMRSLQGYDWPGNIRELANVIERAVIGSDDEKLRLVEGLDTKGLSQVPEGPIESLENMERSHILKVLLSTNWRIEGSNGAAHALGINPSTLRSRMSKLGISKAAKASI